MKMSAVLLIGRHDYRNFCKMDVGNGVLEFIRKIDDVDIVPLNSNDYKTGGLLVVLFFFNKRMSNCFFM